MNYYLILLLIIILIIVFSVSNKANENFDSNMNNCNKKTKNNEPIFNTRQTYFPWVYQRRMFDSLTYDINNIFVS